MCKDNELRDQLPEFFDNAYGMGGGAVWCQIDDSLEMEERREIFLCILRMLFDTGKVFWGVRGVLEADLENVIERIKQSWPESDKFDDDNFITILPYWDDGKMRTHQWVVGDLVWLEDDGDFLWSTDSNL